MIENKAISYKLRKVNNADIDLLFKWANDEEVRNNAIATQKIPFEEHQAWFNKKISAHDFQMFILESDNVPVGQARFEYNDTNKEWEIGYSVAKKFRGLGFSKILLTEAIHSLNKFPIVGYVKIDNNRSNKVLTSLGFVNNGIHQIKNLKLIKYSKKSA